MPKKIRLHARDVELLELLAERKVDSLDALHERFWPDNQRKSAYNRLGALARSGFLTHVPRSIPGPLGKKGGRPAAQHLYLLGPKAPIALRLRGRGQTTMTRRAQAGLPDTLIDHQLATNRVGDALGVRLMGEKEAGAGLARKHRPDGAYRAAPDSEGRELVLVEVDLGHYSRQRILEKVHGFFTHREARSILIASPTDQRADKVADWIRDTYGADAMRRIQILSFDQIASRAPLARGTEPVHRDDPIEDDNWYARFISTPGSR